jgi:hypothetical protein
MSRFARRLHLASAIVASVTCILWSVLTVLVTFRWHTVRPRLALAAIPFVIGVGAIMAFNSMSEMGYYDSYTAKPREEATLGWENC